MYVETRQGHVEVDAGKKPQLVVWKVTIPAVNSHRLVRRRKLVGPLVAGLLRRLQGFFFVIEAASVSTEEQAVP